MAGDAKHEMDSADGLPSPIAARVGASKDPLRRRRQYRQTGWRPAPPQANQPIGCMPLRETTLQTYECTLDEYTVQLFQCLGTWTVAIIDDGVTQVALPTTSLIAGGRLAREWTRGNGRRDAAPGAVAPVESG